MNNYLTTKLIVVSLFALCFSCNKKECYDESDAYNGKLNKQLISTLSGFEEAREGILYAQGVSMTDFIEWSTSPSWELPVDAQNSLKAIRLTIEQPTNTTLIQKVIPLEDVATYMNNTYGGTVGGFIAVSADVKRLSTMFDTYWGLRLDYEGTKFKEDGAGYAVIRFYSEATSKLSIPFSPELGGTQPHGWPNSGGGFTASTLGDGGYPEYTFAGYSAPNNGAELYEVTPEGCEILRSVYVDGKGWQTNEIGVFVNTKSMEQKIRNGVYSDTKASKIFVTTYTQYQGNRYIVHGIVGNEYHLTTTKLYDNVQLEVIEKGIYGISVSTTEIEKVWEETEKL